MIKLEKTSVMNLENAIRGARNPMNSWDRSDSYYNENGNYILGPNDLGLAMKLVKAGPDHRKFLRQIFVSVDITAPLFWWKEYDTYKIATVRNSCSTMHKLMAKPFELSDFSFDECMRGNIDQLNLIITAFNNLRTVYLETTDEAEKKSLWRCLVELLPSGYNQKSTCTLNYETLTNIYYARRTHKLQEWHDFCDWIMTLPYAKELIASKAWEDVDHGTNS